jgi:hypothetical protein
MGVSPFASFIEGSAPASNSNFIIAAFPYAAALCNGVSPLSQASRIKQSVDLPAIVFLVNVGTSRY